MNFFNSCVNPIIYWCLSEQFSKEFRKLLGCNKFNSFTRHHSSTTSSEPNVPSKVNHNTVPTRVWCVKFWWNSFSNCIGLYRAIRSYSTIFVVSHSLLSSTAISAEHSAHILGDMHDNERRASGSLEVKDEPYIYIADSYAYLWLNASEINYGTSERTDFFCQSSLPDKVDLSSSPKERKHIYAFYKISTDRFLTRGQQLWIFLEQKIVLLKERLS